MDEDLLRLPQVISRTGLSRSSIYQASADGKFPRPVALGARAVGWKRSEIDAWVAGRKPKGDGHEKQ